MSSKVLIESATDRVRQFAWRTVALTGEIVDRRRAPGETRSPESNTEGRDPLENSDLERSIEKRLRAAHEAGLQEGKAAGRAEAEGEVRATIERLAQSIAEMDEHRSRVHRQAEVDAVRLSVAIARRVLRRELTVDPAAIEGLVRAALERLQAQESCRVRMHPNHIPTLRAGIDRLGMSAKVEVISDPAQAPGAAIFEMPRGNMDASIDAQLKEIERGLVDRFQRNG